MSKYQPKHARRRNVNRHAYDIWTFAAFPAAMTEALLVRYNGAVGQVTLSFIPSLVRVFAAFGALWVGYAVVLAIFTMKNIEREQRAFARRRAAHEERRRS